MKNYIIHKSDSDRACIVEVKNRYTIRKVALLPEYWDVPKFSASTKDDPLISFFVLDLEVDVLRTQEEFDHQKMRIELLEQELRDTCRYISELGAP